ncbi:MAG: Holliday junction resolvase RuvX [Aquificaceae bacterium]
MKIIAIDYGTKTCGVALSNSKLGVDSVLPPISTGVIIPTINQLIETYDPDILLFGFPLTKSGKVGQRARKVIRLVNYLRKIYTSKPLIEMFDERYSTIEAMEMLKDLPKTKAQKIKDSVSALIILREYQSSLAKNNIT